MVKGTQFNAWRSVGLAAQAVRIHQQRGVDEVCLLDIGATPEGRGPDLDLVRELSEDCFSPLAVGGGVKTVEDVRALLRAGADKVVIREEATPYDDFAIVRACSQAVGCQAIVVAVDYIDDEVFTSGPTAHPFPPEMWAAGACAAGAGEILLTSMSREGTLRGYDLELIRAVSQAVGIPVVAHGGCGTPQHMLEAIVAGANAVAAGSMFLFTDVVPLDCSRFLATNGVEARV